MDSISFLLMIGLANAGNAAMCVLLVIGIIGLLFGYKIIRNFVCLLGFAIGFLVLSTLLSNAPGWLPYLAGVIGGSILGVIFYVFWYLGIFALGAVLGATVVMFLGCTVPIVIGIAAVICGIMAIVIRKFMLIISTSWGGACAIVVALSILVDIRQRSLTMIQIVLFVIGVVCQYATSRHQQKSPIEMGPNKNADAGTQDDNKVKA